MSDPKGGKPIAFKELGVKGVKMSGGFVHDEFLHQLSGTQGRKTYRQMRDNDSTISSILFAIEMLFRAVSWTISTHREGEAGEKDKEFLEGVLFEDMEHPWEDVIMQAATMLTFGWQLSEVTYKRRIGPFETNPARQSKYTDGKIGIRRIADRSQETLLRWEVDQETGDILGMWQQPPFGGPTRFIPTEKSLLFRPHLHKGSPEGRSILRGAYRAWYMLSNLQEIEAIACERELTGLPLVKIPGEYLASDDPEVVAQREEFVAMARDVKLNHQAGAVIPSDPWFDAEGKPTNIPKVSMELLAVKGNRAIDIDRSIRRYQGDIGRTVLADFLTLGQNERGSFALSRSKIDLFAWSIEGWMKSLASVVNRHLIPKLWAMNGFSMEHVPYIVPGRVAPEDIQEVGSYIEALTRSGFLLTDPETEDHLRRVGGLPEAPVGEDRPNPIPTDQPPMNPAQNQNQDDEEEESED